MASRRIWHTHEMQQAGLREGAADTNFEGLDNRKMLLIKPHLHPLHEPPSEPHIATCRLGFQMRP